jgi:hypothetical protein
MPKFTKMIDRTTPLGSEDDQRADTVRRDFILETHDRTVVGKPRMLALKNYDEAFVRIVPPIDYAEHAARRGASDRRDQHAVNRLIAGLTISQDLLGPSTAHEVDELAATLFDEAPNFSGPIQAIRSSAQANIRQGARWLQFMPVVIESGPGSGKTRLVHRLAELSGLPLLYLDCSTMTNLTPILGQDSGWSNARASEIIEGISRDNVANALVVLDELDKLQNHGRHAGPMPSEALVGLFEKRTAAAHLDHFTQLTIDLSFLNWVILTNDAGRLSPPLLDRCRVIRLPPPTPEEVQRIAVLEIERRGLEPELVAPITQAVRRGQITSLRRLHKLLDAAAAASARPILN